MHEEKDPFPPEPPTVPRHEDKGARYRTETERFLTDSLEPPPLWRDPRRRRDHLKAALIGLVVGSTVAAVTWWLLHL